MNIVDVIPDIDKRPIFTTAPDILHRASNPVVIARIPHGMTSGNSCVAVVTELPNGEWVMIEISMRNFLATARIFEDCESTPEGVQ